MDSEAVKKQTKKRRARANRIQFVRGAIGVITLLLAWHLASVYYGIQMLLPTPWTVFKDLFRTVTMTVPKWLYGPTIYQHLERSFLRGLVGFLLSAIIAIPLGLAVGRSPKFRDYISPVIKLLYPVPGIAWIPLAILWFGLNEKAVIFVTLMSGVFPLYFNVEAGVRQINPLLIDAGRCFGCKGFNLFPQVILPAIVPYIVTGLRIALGNVWRMLVAAEMLSSALGVGFLLNESRFLFRAADVMTFMILTSLIGYLTEKIIVDTIERRTIEKWEVRSE